MILVTGASGGIGQQLLPQLKELDSVMGIYHTSKPHSPIPHVQVDLTDKNQVQAFVSDYKTDLNNLTLLHLAGYKMDGLLASYKEEDWDRTMAVNLKGVFLLTQALLPQMIQDKWGRIILCSSKGGLLGDPGAIAYSTSKAGLLGFNRVLAKECARFNITSNVLTLGTFATGMYEALPEEKKKAILKSIPSKKCGEVSNIFQGVKFLRDAAYVNGTQIPIDGGM